MDADCLLLTYLTAVSLYVLFWVVWQVCGYGDEG